MSIPQYALHTTLGVHPTFTTRQYEGGWQSVSQYQIRGVPAAPDGGLWFLTVTTKGEDERKAVKTVAFVSHGTLDRHTHRPARDFRSVVLRRPIGRKTRRAVESAHEEALDLLEALGLRAVERQHALGWK